MRGSWFRLYDELLDDPKVQTLPCEDFRGWVNILCIANRNGGRLPSIEQIAFGLRCTIIAAGSLVDRLTIAGLIDTVKGGVNGKGIAPHGWSQRQYKSDTSTERVKRFRNAASNAPVTPSEAETEAETEEEKNKTCSPPVSDTKKAKAELSRLFDEFWDSHYPKKVGKTRAREVWMREIKLDDVPEVFRAGDRFKLIRFGQDPTYTPHASTWLRNGRWRDSLTDEIPVRTKIEVDRESLFVNREPDEPPAVLTPRDEIYQWTNEYLATHEWEETPFVREHLIERAKGRTEYLAIIDELYPLVAPPTTEGEPNV